MYNITNKTMAIKNVTPDTQLQVLETLCTKYLATMTNQAYVAGYKFSYGMEFKRGTGKIEQEGKTTGNYYFLTVYMIDKSNTPIGKRIDLATNYYSTRNREEQAVILEAYTEFLLNSVRTFVNVHYAIYLEQREKEVVKPSDITIDEKVEALRESAKTPKLIIT